jgi:isopentenyl diphosphate isomerase/L-lactate dehydrogenase-like FMN-dependent dehydrogenase
MTLHARRAFLGYLAASPLYAQSAPGPIAKPEDAINVFDFEPVARQVLPPAHFGYLQTGVVADATLAANRTGFDRYQLRPRRLIDISQIDTSVTLFGARQEFPLLLAPVGNIGAFHAEAELPVARAAAATRTTQILSTYTNTSVETINAAAGRPVWFQLYATGSPVAADRLWRRAEDAGCPVVLLTVDSQAGRNTETLSRAKLLDSRKCTLCHDPAPGGFFKRKPMLAGINMAGVPTSNAALTWDFVRQLRKSTKMKLLIKGLVTHEDARLALECGADGVVVSNHGGRAEESGRGTIECLPEIADAVGGKMTILIDGGFRRGTDIYKALALGANAVCIGRPYVWGLAAFGQPGVERVIDLLRAEFSLIMKQCGKRSIAEITKSSLVLRG